MDEKREGITKSEWKLIINAGNPKFKDWAQSRLVRLLDMAAATGSKTIDQLVEDGILVREKLDSRSNKIKLTKLGIEVRDLILKL